MKLYKYIENDSPDGFKQDIYDYEEAGLDDVIEWFNEIFPADIFITHPIAKVRDMLNAILRGDIPKSGKIPKEV